MATASFTIGQLREAIEAGRVALVKRQIKVRAPEGAAAKGPAVMKTRYFWSCDGSARNISLSIGDAIRMAEDSTYENAFVLKAPSKHEKQTDDSTSMNLFIAIPDKTESADFMFLRTWMREQVAAVIPELVDIANSIKFGAYAEYGNAPEPEKQRMHFGIGLKLQMGGKFEQLKTVFNYIRVKEGPADETGRVTRRAARGARIEDPKAAFPPGTKLFALVELGEVQEVSRAFRCSTYAREVYTTRTQGAAAGPVMVMGGCALRDDSSDEEGGSGGAAAGAGGGGAPSDDDDYDNDAPVPGRALADTVATGAFDDLDKFDAAVTEVADPPAPMSKKRRT